MLNLMTVLPGQRLSLKSGAVAEVLENMGDGIWLQLRDVASGEEELVHCEEIVGLADESPNA
jgi:hypothetical protein